MYKIKLRIISCFVLTAFFFSSCVAPALAAITYTYDSNGNMSSDGTKCYEYNQANQLKKVKTCSNSQTIAEYIYDFNGNRIIKKEYQSGNLKRTIYSPDDEYQTVKQASNGATQNTTFYQANGEIVAQKNPDGSKTYNNTDHLGSSAVLSSQTGTVVEKTAYEPYGEVKSGGTLEKFQYTGQEKDQETGLNYYNARYYDSHLQRFTQADDVTQDWYDPQSLNRYSYVRNNPIRYTDPTGHCFAEPLEFIVCLTIAAPFLTEMAMMTPMETQGVVFEVMAISEMGKDYKSSDGTPIVMPIPLVMGTAGMAGMETSLITKNYEKGMIGEANAGIRSGDKLRVESLSGTAKYRVADKGIENNKIPIYTKEVKNVNTLRITNQMKDFAALGNKYGFKPDLVLDTRTAYSSAKTKQWYENNYNVTRTNLNKKTK